ncbi:DUF3887 domain-containing protein [Halomicroarcula sp. S1AR25-4]|uniref:hypothetical protein n=1 Tax=Haloarcula sp. S1AR25-4 TaxID=2950538 RepID=UPI002877016C|nr:hypothetical protein [Halomicroarcula sp. S1AR25-4]MDS0279494.1 DUF3887 domain-containing protein [Halomicroarcula sp. S1AR25-4]
MSDNDGNELPSEVLEKKSRDIITALDTGVRDSLTSFGQAAATQIVSAWDKTEDVHGQFAGVDEIVVDPELPDDVDMDPSERAVEVYGNFGDEPFKVQLFFTANGDPKGLYIFKDKDVGLVDSLGDAKRLGKSKVSSLTGRLRNRKQEPTDRERDIVTDVVDLLEQGEFQTVYDMLTAELKEQITVTDIESGWTTHIEALEGIENMYKKRGVIQVALADASGSKEFFVTVSDDGTLGTLRIRDT